MSDTFHDKVAIVTGAGSGIGAASTRRLAALGASVIAVDKDEAGVEAVAAEVGATAVVMDVSEPDAWDRLIADVTATSGGIDFAHLNAGVVTMRYPYTIEEVDVAHYRRLMGVNVDGVLLPVAKLVPTMAGRDGGAVVATASLGGLNPFPDDPYYAASKLAVVGFVRSAAPQLAERGVRIHAICPGLVQTEIIRGFIQKKIDDLALPVLDPADVAQAVADMLAAQSTGLVRTIIPGEGVRDHPLGNPMAMPDR